jgi:hypothetical protein
MIRIDQDICSSMNIQIWQRADDILYKQSHLVLTNATIRIHQLDSFPILLSVNLFLNFENSDGHAIVYI